MILANHIESSELENVRFRFWAKAAVGAEQECWEWLGFRNAQGYGLVKIKGRWATAIRIAISLDGRVPNVDQVVRHSCHNRGCVNPKHLSLGSPSDNLFDTISARGPLYEGGRPKLKWSQVEEIRSSDETRAALAERYGVSVGTISSVRTGRTWAEGEAA